PPALRCYIQAPYSGSRSCSPWKPAGIQIVPTVRKVVPGLHLRRPLIHLIIGIEHCLVPQFQLSALGHPVCHLAHLLAQPASKSILRNHLTGFALSACLALSLRMCLGPCSYLTLISNHCE